jgi:hypothetical protein
MFRSALLSLTVLAPLAFATSASLAHGNGPVFSQDHTRVYLPHGIPSNDGLAKLPWKLADCRPGHWPWWCDYGYQKATMFPFMGYTVAALNSNVGQMSQAMQVTAQTNLAVSGLSVGIGYISGTNSINLAIYSDAGGVPGTLLASGDAAGLPAFGSCCDPPSVKFRRTKLTAGTPYWIVVSTDGESPDTVVAAEDNTIDEVDPASMAYNTGSGWTAYPGLPAFSFSFIK